MSRQKFLVLINPAGFVMLDLTTFEFDKVHCIHVFTYFNVLFSIWEMIWINVIKVTEYIESLMYEKSKCACQSGTGSI